MTTETCRCKTIVPNPAEDHSDGERMTVWNRRCPVHGIPPRRPVEHYDERTWRDSQELIERVAKLVGELTSPTFGIRMSASLTRPNWSPETPRRQAQVKAARARLVAESREIDRIVREYISGKLSCARCHQDRPLRMQCECEHRCLSEWCYPKDER